MKRILALDLATLTGYALSGDDGHACEAGTMRCENKRGDWPGTRWGILYDFLKRLRKFDSYRKIYFEEPFAMPMRRSGIGVGFKFSAVVELFCVQQSPIIDCVSVPPSVIKKFATGKGNAKKEQMLAAAQKIWDDVTDHNEADALWLLAYAVRQEHGIEAAAARKRMHGQKEAYP